MYRGIRIGIGLKINNEFICFIKALATLHALFQLFTDGRQFTGKFRCKRVYITIGTSTITFTSVPVGTGKAAINNRFEHALSLIFLFKMRSVIVVAFNA